MFFKKLIGISLVAIFLLSFVSSVDVGKALLWMSRLNGGSNYCDYVLIDVYTVYFADGQTYKGNKNSITTPYRQLSTLVGDGVTFKYPDGYGEAKSILINLSIARVWPYHGVNVRFADMTFPIINGWVCGVTPTNEKIGMIINSHAIVGDFDPVWCFMDNKKAWNLECGGDKVVTYPDGHDWYANNTHINYNDKDNNYFVRHYVGSKLEDRVQLVNDANGRGIPCAVLNFRICGQDNEIIKDWTPLQTDYNGYVDLSDLNFTFFPQYNNQHLRIDYKFDGEDYKYYNSSSRTSIFLTKFDSKLSVNISDVVSVGDKLSGVVRLVNKSSGLGIAGADLNVSIGGRNSYVVRTDDSGCVNLSDPLSNINYFFFNDGKYDLTIGYDGNDYFNPTGYLGSIKVSRLSFTQLSVNNISDVVGVGDKLGGVVRLVNKSSGLGIAGADLNVSLNVLNGGLNYSKVLSTNSDGGIDLSYLAYNFTVDGKYNLSVVYNGDNYYESASISKMLICVSGSIVPRFNGTFHPDNPYGYYNVHVK
jgi:5-hydroxyisourate hydrolase-like protein (transthyretin family)